MATTSRVRRARTTLLTSTALQSVAALVLAMPAAAQPAPNARPTGGVVVGGAAVIGQTANNTAITQTSARAAVDWRSFDVGSKQSVTFKQPSAQAITLNTVTGPNPSQIAGRIDANGQIVLVNQSGVTFYKGAQVNTAGLMVSAAGANTAQFMAGGNIAFDKGGNPNARIVNDGSITIKGAGLASLVAPSVANSGVINARLGHVVLAGAKTATLDLYGDKLVNVVVTGAVTKAPDGTDALVTNTGVISADGGTVQLTAKAVDGLVTNLVSAGGTIEANTAGSNQGRIVIAGLAGGSITIDGMVSAAGKEPGTKGGQIALKAAEGVSVKSTAVVSASGTAGGGTVAIGTTLKRASGGPAVTGAKAAKGVLVQQGAAVTADATVKGNGGRVVALGSELTEMAGSISARGGPAGGNGGFVEASGGVLVLTGKVDATAPKGQSGKLLLDPLDLYVSDTQPAAATYSVVGRDLPTILAGDAPDAATVSWVTPTLLQAQAADLSLAASRSLFVKTSVGTPNTLSIGVHNLTLTALATLSIDAGFVINAGNVNLIAQGATAAGGNPAINANLINFGTVSATGNILLNIPTLGFLTNAGSLLAPNGTATLRGGDVTQSGIVQAATVAISGDNITLSGATISQAATPTGPTGGIAVTANVDPVFGSASTLSLNGGTVSAIGGNVSLFSAGGIAINGATIIASPGTFTSGATLSLGTGSGGVSQDASSRIDAGTLRSTGTIANAVSLIGTANTIGTLGVFSVSAGDFALLDATSLLVTGEVAAENIFVESNTAGGAITLSDATLRTSFNPAGNGRIALVADTVTARGDTAVNAAPIAANGTVELAPFSAGQPITLGGTSSTFAGTLLNDINVGNGGTLVVGRYTDVTRGNAPVTPAGSITVFGGVVAPTIVLAATGPGGVTVDGGAVVGDINDQGVVPQGNVVIQAPSLTIQNAGTIMANSFGYGPASDGGTVTLGLTGGLATMAGIGAANVIIGTVPNYSTAAQINVVGAFDAVGLPLTLNAAGPVTEAAPLLNVAALSGTAGSYALTNRLNSIAQVGTSGLFATAGDIAIVDTVPIRLAGDVVAPAGNVLLQEVTPGAAISLADINVISSVGGTIGLVADAIDAGTLTTLNTAEESPVAAGMVEIAPATSGLPISFGGTAGLSISANLLAAASSSAVVRFGGYHDSTLGTPTDRVTAGDINIGLPVTVAGTRTLRLDGGGSIIQGASGTVTVGTLDATIVGVAGATPGSIVLNTPANAIGTLGTVTTAFGDITVTNSAPLLTIANSSVVAGNNVTIVNQGSVVVGGTLAAGGTGLALGTLVVNASAGDIVIDAPASVSAPELVALNARDSVTQAGGLVHAADVVLSGGTVTQTGGTVFGQGASGSAVVISASSGGFTQLAAGPPSPPIVASNSGIAINAGTLTSNGTIIAGGSLTGTLATLNQAGGVIVAGLGLSFPDAIITRSGGVLNGGSSLTINDNQDGGTLGANVIDVSIGDGGGTLPAFTGGAAVIAGSAPGGATPLTLPQYSIAGRPQTIQVTYAGDTTISRPLAADTVILTGTGTANLSETSGSIQAFTLIGSANGNVLLTGAGNAVSNLGPYSASGTFALNNAQPLNVIGAIGPNGPVGVNVALAAVDGLNLGADVSGTRVDLTANGGAVSQTGGAILTASTLAASGNVVALGGNNIVGTLAAGSASNSFLFSDSTDLRVSGTVNGGPSATIISRGGLSVDGMVTANAVRLIGADIAIPGKVSDDGTVDLIATTGSITETGTLIAGTLSGSSAGSTTLAGATAMTNQVGRLGPFGTGTGFLLRDGTQLLVSGPVSASSGGVTISTSSGATSAPADLALAGPIVAPGGTVALTATGNTFETGNGLVRAAFARVSAGTNPDGSPFLINGPAATVNYPNNNVVGGVVAIGLGGVVFNPNLLPAPAFNLSVDLLAGATFFKDSGGIAAHASGGPNYQFGAFILGAISYPSDEADLLLPLISDLEY